MDTENSSQVSQEDRINNDAERLSLLKRLRVYAYRKFPHVFPDPDYKRHIAVWQKRDDKRNIDSSPPDDELVQLHSITIAEIYTPSHIDKLLRCIKALGWHKNELFGQNPVSWIQRSRDTSHGGGWLNLGPIRRLDGKESFGLTRAAQLPEHVQFALGQVYSVTSSVTCIVMTFVFDDDYALRFDMALRAKRSTYSERTGRGYKIVEPYFQKENEIREIRKTAESKASEWVRANLPGLFASGVLGQHFPTCEFLSLNKAEPFGSERHEYLRALGVSDDYGAWIADDVPGLKFSEPTFGDGNRFHATLAINMERLNAIDLRAWGGETRSAYVSYLDEHLHGLMSRWALLAVIAGFEKAINANRDSLLIDVRQDKNTLRAMSKMTELISAGVDIATIAADLRQFSARKGLFEHNLPKFTPSHSEYFAAEMTLAKGLREQMETRIERLQETNRSIRDLVLQQGTMLSATKSISLQNRVEFMTWVIVVLTIVTTIFTAVASYEPMLKMLGRSS